jgi:TM2 domain-containing membrane protein YozV
MKAKILYILLIPFIIVLILVIYMTYFFIAGAKHKLNNDFNNLCKNKSAIDLSRIQINVLVMK